MIRMGHQGWWLAAVLTATLASCAAAQGGAGGSVPACASKLTSCVAYINGTTTPPASCCGPLKEAVTEERECLCNIYNNTALLQAVNINITQALNLPKLCHINTGKTDNICQAGSGSEFGSKTGSRRMTMAGLVSSFLFSGIYLML